MKQRLILVIFLLALLALACGEATAPGEAVVSTVTASVAATVVEVEEAVAEEPAAIETATAEPAAETAYLGDLVEASGYSLAVVAFEDPAPPGILYTAEEGEKLVAVEVIVGNVSGQRITVNALNARLLDTEGFVYLPELAGHDDQITLLDLEPGQRVRGWIAFTIPEEASAELIRYEFDPRLTLESRVSGETGETAVVEIPPLTASDAPQHSVEARLGDLVERDGYSLTVQVVEDPAAPGILYTPQPGMRLVAVEIVVGNVSGEPQTVNVLNSYLVDGDGFVYQADIGAIDDQIELVDIGPGERARGWVPFTIPENAAPYSLRYQVTGFPLLELESGLE